MRWVFLIIIKFWRKVMKIQIWFALAMFIFSSSVVNSQIVNSFGIKIGGAKANQTWTRYSSIFGNN